MRWLITREADDAAPLVEELRAAGVDAVCIPAIERAPLPWPAKLSVDDGLVLCTSPYAARLALAALKGRARLRYAALAPSTLAVLTSAHVRVDVVAEGGAVALAKAVAAAGVRGLVLYPTSDAGLAQPEQERALAILEAAGCSVERAAVYTTVPAPKLDDELRALGEREVGAVVFSPSAARALYESVKRVGARVQHALAVGASTAAAAPGATLVASGELVARIVDIAQASAR